MLDISKMEILVISVLEINLNHKQEMQRVVKIVEVQWWQMPNAQPVVNSFKHSHHLVKTTESKQKNHIISIEPISKSRTSIFIHELNMTYVWIDVIGAFWRAMERKLYRIVWIVYENEWTWKLFISFLKINGVQARLAKV